MNTLLKLKINKNFRDPISLESDISIFKGRNHFVQRLKNIALSRKSATVLVGGARGAGKTSFVRESLRLAKQAGEEQGLIVIELTLADLDRKEEGLKGFILKRLIRALYFKLASEDVKELKNVNEELEELYEKTYYSELEEQGIIELTKSRRTVHEHKESEEKVIRWDIGQALKRVLKIVFGTTLIFSLPISLSYLNLGAATNAIVLILALIFTTFVLSVEYEFRDVNVNFEGEDKRVGKKSKNTGIAKYDLSADTLEIGLKNVLRKLSQTGHKIIFTLDELDKLDDTEKESQRYLIEHAIYKVIKPLKNLFSLSNAIFVFITSSDFYRQIEEKRRIDPYSAVHTLFSDRFFLSPLYHRDISSIIDDLVAEEIQGVDSEMFTKFKYFISWAAKNHIFDAHNLIENYLEFEDDEIYLHIYTGDVSKKGNIEEEWQKAAALQVFITATYEEKAYPADSELNEKLYLTLREVAEILHTEKVVKITGGGYLELLDQRVRENLNIEEGLEEKTREDFEGAIEDFFLRTERADKYDITDSREETETITTKEGAEVKEKVEVFTFKKDFTFPVLEKIKQKTTLTAYEEEFLQNFEALQRVRKKLKRHGLETFSKYEDEHEIYSKLAGKLRKETPRNERKSEVQSYTSNTRKILEEIRLETIRGLIDKYVRENPDLLKHPIERARSGRAMWDEDNRLVDFYQHTNEVYQADKDYKLLNNIKKDKFLLIGFDFKQEDQDVYANLSRNVRLESKTSVINVVKNKKVNKGGVWRVIEITDSLSNIGALKREIEVKIIN